NNDNNNCQSGRNFHYCILKFLSRRFSFSLFTSFCFFCCLFLCSDSFFFGFTFCCFTGFLLFTKTLFFCFLVRCFVCFPSLVQVAVQTVNFCLARVFITVNVTFRICQSTG